MTQRGVAYTPALPLSDLEDRGLQEEQQQRLQCRLVGMCLYWNNRPNYLCHLGTFAAARLTMQHQGAHHTSARVAREVVLHDATFDYVVLQLEESVPYSIEMLTELLTTYRL